MFYSPPTPKTSTSLWGTVIAQYIILLWMNGYKSLVDSQLTLSTEHIEFKVQSNFVSVSLNGLRKI